MAIFEIDCRRNLELVLILRIQAFKLLIQVRNSTRLYVIFLTKTMSRAWNDRNAHRPKCTL